METQESITARAERVKSALETAFGVRGRSLAIAVRRTGRRIPKRIRTDALRIVDAQGVGGHPKRLRQVDGAALAAAERRVLHYLQGIDRADARKGRLLGIAGAVAFNVLLVLIAFIAWLVWAGHV
ncbi:MAG: hypothetical protein AB3N09_12920 [Tateyamaria sp.]